MLAISLAAAVFLVAICGGAIGVIAWLLSGSPAVVTRQVRASATSGSDGGASGSDRPAPTLAARPEHRDP